MLSTHTKWLVLTLSISSILMVWLGIDKVSAKSKNLQPNCFSTEEWNIAKSFIRNDFTPKDQSNQYLLNDAAARFGKTLFFSTKLSINDEFSCASCHQPNRDWTDGIPLATGINKGTRNTPSLWNTAFNRWYFWDGRADSAWAQALGPIENPDEMASSRLTIVKTLANNPEFFTQYTNIFGDDLIQYNNQAFLEIGRPEFGSPALPKDDINQWPELSVDQQNLINRIFANVGKSIAAFEATIISPPSSFDNYIQDPESNHLTESAISGFKLFIGKAGCIRCHMGPELTNGEFHNIRLPSYEGGRYDGIRQLFDSEFTQVSRYSDNTDDAKILYLKQVKRNWGEFKVPSLRRVKHTAPYMHDGRFNTLGDVIEYYSELTNAISDGHLNETIIKALSLTREEKNSLVEFLGTL